MATIFRAGGGRREIPDGTVGEARRRGDLPAQYVPVRRDPMGYSEQLGNNDLVEGEVLLVPRNRAG